MGYRILQKFGGAGWYEAELDFAAGKAGSRQVLEREWSTVEVEPQVLQQFVLTKGQLDPEFAPFAQKCRERNAPLFLLSDGLDLYIQPLIQKFGLDDLPLYCNRARLEGKRVVVEFPYYDPNCGHGCANCKERQMLRLRPTGKACVYIGDGWSDRHAAQKADLVFAKRELLSFCREQGIPCIPFRGFGEIAAALRL